MNVVRIVLQVAVAWIALDVVFGILWAWAWGERSTP